MGCGCNKKTSTAGLDVSGNTLGLGTGGTTGLSRTSLGTRKLAGIPLIQTRAPDTSDTNSVLSHLTADTQVPIVQAKSGYNLLDVIKDKVTGNLEYASDETQQVRLEHCNNCSHKVAGICSQCGCVVQMKVRYANSSCPINKW